jgi:membrane associated rhomboid family serine protease
MNVAAREPIFNVPGAVLAVLGVLAAVHLGRSLLAPDDDARLVYALAFIPARYRGLGEGLPGGEIAKITSWVTHMLVHGDVLHLAFNSAWLLAFGGAITQRVGGARFLAFAAFSGVAGALTFFLINPDLEAPVVGASGAIAGLMGGTMRFLFSAIDHGGFRQLRDAPRSVRLMPLSETLADRRIQIASGMLVLVNVLAMVGFGSAFASGGIAWEAHLGGYFAGLLAFGFFDRPTDTNSQPNGD